MSDKEKHNPINMDELDQMIHDSITENVSNHDVTNKRQSEEDDSHPKRIRQDELDLELEMAIQRHNQDVDIHKDENDRIDPAFTGDAPKTQEPETRSDTEVPQSQSDGKQDSAQPQSPQSGRQTPHRQSSHEPEHQEEKTGPTEPKPATVVHQGMTIPADSELLKSRDAFNTYSELPSQIPSIPATNTHLLALPMPITAADYLPPRIQLLVNTLPTVDNLSTQILRIFTVKNYQNIIDIVSNLETPEGASFHDLTSLFEFTKRLYSEDDPFLTVSHIAPGIWKENEPAPVFFRNHEQTIESTLRKVNLATFLLATLGVIEVGFFYLNEFFLNIFCPLNNLDPESSLSNSGLNNNIQGSINPIGDKIGKLLKPQAILYLDLKTQAYISAIEAGERSRVQILDDILPENIDIILMSRRDVKILSPTEMDFVDRCKARRNVLLNYPDNSRLSEEYDWFQFLRSLFEFVSKNMLFLIWGTKKVVKLTNKSDQSKLQQHLLQSSNSSNETTLGNEIPDTLLPSEILEQQLHVALAEKPSTRISIRRPWSRDEEKALRHALEVEGPHWSKILELFGAGGKISEALKNRTQVQLKDKARNWKMFFLKSGLPVPLYLQKVTGDMDREDKRSKKTAAAPIPNINSQKK